MQIFAAQGIAFLLHHDSLAVATDKHNLYGGCIVLGQSGDKIVNIASVGKGIVYSVGVGKFGQGG
jgi:hypothetical protein